MSANVRNKFNLLYLAATKTPTKKVTEIPRENMLKRGDHFLQNSFQEAMSALPSSSCSWETDIKRQTEREPKRHRERHKESDRERKKETER